MSPAQSARSLDAVLRGEADPLAPDGLRPGPLARATVVLAALSGACVGVYGATRPDGPEWRLVVAAMVKVPLLILLTVLVTFPSLYVFGSLLGGRLRAGALVRLVAAACAVLSAVAAGFGPVVAFFSVSTTSYPFVLLLNVAVFALGGLFAAGYVRRAVARSAPDDTTGRRVVLAWLVLFGLVGSQMGYVLRPFVGAPGVEFAWLRPRGGSFAQAIVNAVVALFGS